MFDTLKSNRLNLTKALDFIFQSFDGHQTPPTVSLWNASMKRDFNRRYSSVWPHFGPLNTKHGLTHVPILSFLKSCRPLYCLMPNSTISSNSCSNMRPSIKLSGRFFDVDPNINSVQSFFSVKLKRKRKWQWATESKTKVGDYSQGYNVKAATPSFKILLHLMDVGRRYSSLERCNVVKSCVKWYTVNDI